MGMMCSYVGAHGVNDVKYEALPSADGHGWSSGEWEQHKPVLMKQNAMVTLPYVVNHATDEVTSGSATYLYLGRMLGVCGETQREQRDNEQVLHCITDMQLEFVQLCH